jgi:hypothetical protein
MNLLPGLAAILEGRACALAGNDLDLLEAADKILITCRKMGCENLITSDVCVTKQSFLFI